MNRNLLVGLSLAFVVGACSTAKTPPPQSPVAPKPAPEKPTPPPAAPKVVKEAPKTPPEKPAPVRKIEEALAKVEEGRIVQRAKGEGGADDAIALYRAALELDPQCTAALWELGWSHQLKDELDAALKAWDQLKTIDANYPEFATNYPVLKMRRDQAHALANLPDAKNLLPPEEVPRDGPTVTIAAVGDVNLGQAWPDDQVRLPPGNAEVVFEKIKSHLSGTDVTFGNLETVLADEGESKKCGKKSKRCYAFRVPTQYAKTLKAVGFDVMSIANNHTGDYGEEGRASTIKALDDAKILHSGPVGDIASWVSNGLRIGLVAFSTGGGVYRVQDIDTAVKVVAQIDKTHDLVIVSFHGGAEGSKHAHVAKGTEMFLGENRGNLRKFTRSVIDAGADLILGHGPHLLRGMEIYKGRLIAYSLGNFTGWECLSLRGPLGISTVLKLKLATNGVILEADLVPVVLDKPGIPRPDPKKKAHAIVRTLSKEDFGSELFDKNGQWRRK